MFELLILVIGCYVLAALSVHLAYWVRGKMQQTKLGKHYVLVADGRQHQMEWYIRSMFSFSRWMGRDVRLTIIDRAATDETTAIVERMARKGDKVKLHVSSAGQKSDMKTGKRLRAKDTDATQLLWMLQEEGIVSHAEHAVLIDLQNPSDLSKMPF
ncbi:hypothetical protein D3C80_1501870 [compost metagenome]